MALKTIFCLFLIDFRPPQIPKNIGRADAFEYFYVCVLIALETDLGPILGSILGSKIEPKSVPRGSRMVLEIIVVFEGLQDPLKSIFQPTWPQHVPNLAPNMPPSSAKNGAEIGPGGLWDPMDPHGTPLNQVWIDFGLILG